MAKHVTLFPFLLSLQEKHVHFSQLTSAEKGQYIDFIEKNHIPIDKDPQTNDLTVRFKLKKSEANHNNKENILKPRQTTTSTMRISKVQEKMNESKIPKKPVENKAFVLACTLLMFCNFQRQKFHPRQTYLRIISYLSVKVPQYQILLQIIVGHSARYQA